MASERRSNAIKNLVELYTIVIGVALSLAVIGLVGTERGLSGISFSSLLLFVAFLVTLFPFYHGALRHLWDAYLESDNEHIRPGAVVPDFALLFMHALAFVVLALLLDRPSQFAWVLVGVFGIDVVWGVFVYFGASSKNGASTEAKWTVINAIFVIVAALYLVLTSTYLGDPSQPGMLAALVAIACAGRTLADYLTCWRFYFPLD